MDERFLVLSTKIIVLLILFPLSQLGSEFKFRSAAQKLAGADAVALRKIVSSLELVPEPIIRTKLCDEDQFRTTISISCDTNDTDGRHITTIFMVDARLTGEIPEDFAELKYLQNLDLSNNKLHGSIPTKLGDLSNLITLDLSQNHLTGGIPLSLGNLKNLQELYLDQNLLSGTIPATLGNLSSLTILSLLCNQLSGDIPSELGLLSKLEALYLDDNELTGNPPRQLGNLSNLLELWLGSNILQGTLPPEYESLKNLNTFEVGGTTFSGAIPHYIAKWDHLTDLTLIGNNFEGEMPLEIFSMKNLEYLEVSNLKNPGFTFPNSANLPNIYTVILRNCNINGVIPSYISNWTDNSLQNLDLSFNNLIGEIPDSFKELSLDRLFLTGNQLNGTFPTWIIETVKILGDLSYNNFTFEPQMDLRYNNSVNIEPRNRTFPQEIMDKYCHRKESKYHSLFINAGGEEITIGRNHYEADNSTSNFYVSPAYNWAYSCNGDFLGKNSNSSDFISSPKCGFSVNSEEASLYSKARLCPQSLIYYGFCLRNGHYTVKLHFSEIIFSNDEDLSSSGKRMFDIYIQGKLERKDFNIKEKEGGPNKILTENFTVHVDYHQLKIELFWDGKGSLYSPHSVNGPLISAISVTPNFKVGGLSTTEIAGIALAAVLALTVLLVVTLALMWRMGWIGDRESRMNKVTLEGKSYTIKQVKDATRNFSNKNKIGEGRFGIVYKAELPDEMTVAVKKLSPQSKHEIGQIGTEVYALKQLDENDNVVKLLDCYSRKDLHLLIYEYMEKGSLQHALFDPNSDVEIDWPTRIRICLGIAKGLKYLHEDKKSCKIVHRNIKPSNILLDGNRNAKVADFGLAKIYDEENPYKFIQEKGTAVYMAPEYATRKAITDKVDVYSFGIVVLEIVSRQTNAKYDENQETVFLLDTASVLRARGSLFDLVDKNMAIINRDMRNQAIEVLELAMKCVDQSPTLRPTMSEVVSELEKISNISTRSG